jgi:hypothetical protein
MFIWMWIKRRKAAKAAKARQDESGGHFPTDVG